MTKKHIILILLLSLVSTLLVQWNLTRAILLDDYLKKPNIVYENNDEQYYLSLISESAKGRGSIGNPFLKEWSEQPYLYVPLNVQFVGFVQRTLHFDVKAVSILFDYGAVYILMMMIFILFALIFRYHLFGYLGSIGYIFLPRMFDIWKRPISPQVNFIPLFVFFYFYFSKISFWKRELGMAFAVGAMFYTYPYHWTFVLAFLVLSDAQTFYQNRKILTQYFYKYLVMAIISIGYILNFYYIHNLYYYMESMGRIGALASRMPAGYYTQALIVGFLIIYFAMRLFDKTRGMLCNCDTDFNKIILGLCAGLVVLNQQFVTGMQLEFNTHYLPVILLFVVFYISALFFILWQNVIGKNKNIVLVCALILTLSLAIISVRNETRVYPQPFSDKNIPNTFLVYNWLQKNNITNEIIYAPDDMANDIPIYTGNYVVFSELARLQLMPTSDLFNRFKYFDITNTTITNDLIGRQRDVFG
ncbi:MAG: hypothetical protein AAB795_03225, partial [Patescibacteria group bacterium]